MKFGLKLSWLITVVSVVLLAGVAVAAEAQLPASAPVEKELAAKASDVTEVTLDKNMLVMAAQFMKKDKDEEGKKFIQGLDGIYVRTYEFDKAGEFTAEQVEQLRKHYITGEWKTMVHEHSTKKDSESTDVMFKTVNGENRGLLVLTVEPKEITIVLILGVIKMDDLDKLNGFGVDSSALSGLEHNDGKKKGGK